MVFCINPCSENAYPDRGQVITKSAKQYVLMPTSELFGIMIRLIDAALFDLTVNVVRFLARKKPPLIAQGQASALLVSDRANVIFFDPASAANFVSRS